MDGGEEVAGGLVVAVGDGPELLEFGEEVLDQVTCLVEGAVECPRRPPMCGASDSPPSRPGGPNRPQALVFGARDQVHNDALVLRDTLVGKDPALPVGAMTPACVRAWMPETVDQTRPRPARRGRGREIMIQINARCSDPSFIAACGHASPCGGWNRRA